MSANDALQQIGSSTGICLFLKTEQYLKILDTDSRRKKVIYPQEWGNAMAHLPEYDLEYCRSVYGTTGGFEEGSF